MNVALTVFWGKRPDLGRYTDRPQGSIGFLTSAQTASGMKASSPQLVDPSVGRHLAETVCSACHQISATSPNPGPSSGAPSFVDISRMPSMSELAIKVFLRTSHPTMPNYRTNDLVQRERLKCKSLVKIHRSISDFAIHFMASIIGEVGSILSRTRASLAPAKLVLRILDRIDPLAKLAVVQ